MKATHEESKAPTERAARARRADLTENWGWIYSPAASYDEPGAVSFLLFDPSDGSSYRVTWSDE